MSGVSADAVRRRNIRVGLFGSVGELADIHHQRATWLDPEMQNPHYSFVEFFECFYDVAGGSYDATSPDAEDAPFAYLVSGGDISCAERDALWPLHEALRGYCEPSDAYDHEAILDDPTWHDVCRVASEVRSNLLALIVDPAERAYFENVLPSAQGKRWP